MDAICFPEYEPFEFDGSEWFLIEDDGNPVAYCGWRKINANIGELCRSGVLPEARGKGLQKYMLGYRESVMRNRQIILSVTTTDKNNFRSINNLIDCGYRACAKDDWPTVKADKSGAVYWKKRI